MTRAPVELRCPDARVDALVAALGGDWTRPGQPDASPCAVVATAPPGLSEQLGVVNEVRAEHPDLPLVLVTPDVRQALYRRLLLAGANGVLLDEDVGRALGPTVDAALAGQLVLPPMARRHATQRPLSVREREVLGLVALGLTNAAMAEQLVLTESTIKSHLSSAFAKLGVTSRAEATELLLDGDSGLGLGVLRISPAERTGRSRMP